MNNRTFDKRYEQLSSEVYRSDHTLELLNIMSQQLEEDTSVVDRQIIDPEENVA